VPPPAKKTAGQIEKETNSSPQSSQKTLRKIILNNLCALACSAVRYFLEMASDFMKFHTRCQEREVLNTET